MTCTYIYIHVFRSVCVLCMHVYMYLGVLEIQQERQFTYIVIFRRVHVTIVTVQSSNYHIFCVCVCSLIYPTRNTHAPYDIVICGLPGSTIFDYFISQTARFSGKTYCT
jgi:hypothetical protein